MIAPRQTSATWRMVALLAAAFAAFIFPVAALANAVPAYVADASRAAEGTVSLSLELSDAISPRPTHAAARVLPVGMASQIADVACDGKQVDREAHGKGWKLPNSCRNLTWTVTLPRVTGGVAGDDQTSVFFEAGWGIIADTAFLRPVGWDGSAGLRIVEAGRPDRHATLPPLRTAPAFYLIGDPPLLEVGGPDGSLIYVADHPDEVLRYISPEQHAIALTYLRAVIGPNSVRDLSEITVIWLRVSRSTHGLGAAAGENAMLVNYFGDTEKPTQEEAAMPFVMLLHEQFHQLVEVGLPLWASESLATYFAMKAATRTARDGPAIAALWTQLMNEAPPAAPGLLAIQRQVLEQDDPSNYGLFYSKGTMFWRELDRAIQDATGGSRTLDSVMPLLLESGFDADGRLSPSLRAALRPLSEGQIDALVEFYLI